MSKDDKGLASGRAFDFANISDEVARYSLYAWAERRPHRTADERAAIARAFAEHLPDLPHAVHIKDEDVLALRSAHIRRFDEDLPRTETLFAVAMIGYRMALRDAQAIEARSGQTTGLDRNGESAVGNADAPQSPSQKDNPCPKGYRLTSPDDGFAEEGCIPVDRYGPAPAQSTDNEAAIRCLSAMIAILEDNELVWPQDEESAQLLGVAKEIATLSMLAEREARP